MIYKYAHCIFRISEATAKLCKITLSFGMKFSPSASNRDLINVIFCKLYVICKFSCNVSLSCSISRLKIGNLTHYYLLLSIYLRNSKQLNGIPIKLESCSQFLQSNRSLMNLNLRFSPRDCFLRILILTCRQ